jgi:uncharacterized protein (TIGR02145 family)
VAGGKTTAGKKLKSTSSWSGNRNGTDDFGFSALPGGSRYTDGNFYDAGYYGDWWTAAEYGSGYAYDRLMYYNDNSVSEFTDDKEVGFAVRCVRD